MLTLATPDLRLFWTAYDPLDLASGSIDVLGFQAGYIALANKLLPGFTTVTTSPRYVSMLCAAVVAAEEAVPGGGDATVRLRQARIGAVKSYERAWALACGLAAGEAAVGDKAVDGLRGVQYVRRRLSELSGREKAIRTSSFNLLANQVRYGGIGAYSTLMEDCHLATMRSVAPRPLGARLADSFTRPDDDLAVWDEDRPLPLDRLREWGLKCHLGEFTREEGQCLATALRGGEEGGWEDDVRWASLRMLAKVGEDGIAESVLLERLLGATRDGTADRLKTPPPCVRQIEAALVLIRPYERLYQAVQFLFDAVRAAATDEPEARLDSLAATAPCVSALQGVRAAAVDLHTAMADAATIHPETANDCRAAFATAGVVGFAEAACGVPDGMDLLGLVLDRHRDVQQGKFDRGERKAAWVRRDPAHGSARLTAQRHQLPRSGRYDSWDQVPWHPYRTFGARRFVKACGIR
jgi:hypothetical protein